MKQDYEIEDGELGETRILKLTKSIHSLQDRYAHRQNSIDELLSLETPTEDQQNQLTMLRSTQMLTLKLIEQAQTLPVLLETAQEEYREIQETKEMLANATTPKMVAHHEKYLRRWLKVHESTLALLKINYGLCHALSAQAVPSADIKTLEEKPSQANS